MLLLLAVLLIAFAWDSHRRRWSPTQTVTTVHYVIESSATPEQTERIGQAAEALHRTYCELFAEFIAPPSTERKLKMKLFKNREEFRFCNRIYGWAEAFYRNGCCHQYYPTDEPSPHHWMLHEATHQLNREVAGFRLTRWLEEGIAGYFSTSMLRGDRLDLGMIDLNTYPIWWLEIIGTSGDIEADVANGSVIPLATILRGRGGPPMKRQFNLYYLHWWSLTHFLFHHEEGMYRAGLFKLIRAGGTLDAFEEHIGPVGEIQQQWYDHVQILRRPFAHPAGPPRQQESSPSENNTSPTSLV